MRRASVTLESDSLPEPRFTQTDTDGRYSFVNLPSGSYRIRVVKPGIVTLEFGAKWPFVRPSPLNLREAESVIADLTVPRGAALEGRVFNDVGPAENILISAVRLAYDPMSRRPVAVTQARTDDLGRFRLHSLPPGHYFVSASTDPVRPFGEPMASREQPTAYARTFYPGSTRLEEAQGVSVAMGQEISGLDFKLISQMLSRLTVRVLEQSGNPVKDVSVRLQPVRGPVVATLGVTDPRAIGAVAFPAVPPGDYWLLATDHSPEGAFAAIRTSVADGVDDIEVRVGRGARLEGRIDAEGEGSRPSVNGLQVAAYPAEFAPADAAGNAVPALPTVAKADGRFTVTNLFGPRIFRVNGLPQGWAVSAVRLDNVDIVDTVTDFQGIGDPRSLRIEITNRTASVTGTVVDERGRLVADYRVVIFSADERRWNPPSRFVKSAMPSGTDRFTVDGLLPGDYLICAVDYLEDESWNDFEILRRLRSLGTPITLAAGASQKAALTLRTTP